MKLFFLLTIPIVTTIQSCKKRTDYPIGKQEFIQSWESIPKDSESLLLHESEEVPQKNSTIARARLDGSFQLKKFKQLINSATSVRKLRDNINNLDMHKLDINNDNQRDRLFIHESKNIEIPSEILPKDIAKNKLGYFKITSYSRPLAIVIVEKLPSPEVYKFIKFFRHNDKKLKAKTKFTAPTIKDFTPAAMTKQQIREGKKQLQEKGPPTRYTGKYGRKTKDSQLKKRKLKRKNK